MNNVFLVLYLDRDYQDNISSHVFNNRESAVSHVLNILEFHIKDIEDIGNAPEDYIVVDQDCQLVDDDPFTLEDHKLNLEQVDAYTVTIKREGGYPAQTIVFRGEQVKD